jgi:mRNA-degrading endonuclease toxin of MazEF toxin-antitoxin module
MNPGEVYMADLGEATPHPVIIVSREELNRGDRAVAVLCTSQKFAVRSTLPHCVPFQAGQFGFTKDCVAQCENIFLVAKNSLDINPIGVLSDAALRDVIKAIGYVIEADCEPN